MKFNYNGYEKQVFQLAKVNFNQDDKNNMQKLFLNEDQFIPKILTLPFILSIIQPVQASQTKTTYAVRLVLI